MTTPLRLNHLFRVVDADTFAAARDSVWLREVFAPSELRTTRRPDWEYTGLYWYGTHTYLELFEEGDQGPIGASGLAFAVEDTGGTARVAEVWRETLGDVDHRLVLRPTEADAVPWFHIARAVPDTRGTLKLWSMEYDADFLRRWHPGRTTAHGITRADILQRYTTASGGPASPLLGDVIAVSVALSPAERGFLERHLPAFDAPIRDVGGEARYVEGDGWSLGIAPASATHQGVQHIVCRLQRPGGRETITIGRITIEVDGTRAVWHFRDA